MALDSLDLKDREACLAHQACLAFLVQVAQLVTLVPRVIAVFKVSVVPLVSKALQEIQDYQVLPDFRESRASTVELAPLE